MRSQSTNLTDTQTDRQTDGQTDVMLVATCDIARRAKNRPLETGAVLKLTLSHNIDGNVVATMNNAGDCG